MKSNDFFLEGNIKAVLNTGGELYADKISWNQEKELITATGHFPLLQLRRCPGHTPAHQPER